MLFPKREGLENQTPLVLFLFSDTGFFLRLQRFRSCTPFVCVLGKWFVEFWLRWLRSGLCPEPSSEAAWFRRSRNVLRQCPERNQPRHSIHKPEPISYASPSVLDDFNTRQLVANVFQRTKQFAFTDLFGGFRQEFLIQRLHLRYGPLHELRNASLLQ